MSNQKTISDQSIQTLGYMNLRGTGKGFQVTVLVMVRQGPCGRYIKTRKSGAKENHFGDEELYLNNEVEQGDVDRVFRLMEGETIFC